MSPYASGTLWRLEQWIDTFDAYLIDNDILDYPGAEAKADAEWNEYDAAVRFTSEPGAVFEYNPATRIRRGDRWRPTDHRAAWADDYECKRVDWWESNRLPSERGRP